MNNWQAFQAAILCQSVLSDAGLAVNMVQDPDEIASAVKDAGKSYLTPWLDPAVNDFTEGNHFWLVAADANGVAMVGGARIDDFGMQPGRAMQSMFRRGYGDGAVLKVSSECDRELRGRVAYFGDLHSRSTSSLGRTRVRCFCGLANFIAVSMFKCETVYSFIRRKDISRGSADVNGFNRKISQPLEWGWLPEARSKSECIAFRKSDSHDEYFNDLILELGSSESK